MAFGIIKAEEIRTAVARYEFSSGGDLYKVGVSIGMVTADAAGIDLAELQRKADAACYAAKNAGRNRVHVAALSVQSISTGSCSYTKQYFRSSRISIDLIKRLRNERMGPG